jgi:hypothetical protein
VVMMWPRRQRVMRSIWHFSVIESRTRLG